MLAVCGSTIYRYNGGESEILLNLNCPTPVIDYGGDIYYATEQGILGKVWKFSPTRAHTTKLFQYQTYSEGYTELAVSTEYVAATELSTNCVIVYGESGGDRQRHKHHIADKPTQICFHPDGDLLVIDADNDSLVKCELYGQGQHHIVWKYSDLRGPCGVCTNSDGNIFVGSSTRKVVYVISGGGKQLSGHNTLATSMSWSSRSQLQHHSPCLVQYFDLKAG